MCLARTQDTGGQHCPSIPSDETEMIVRKGFHISNFVPLVLAIKKLVEPLPDLRTCQQNTRDDLVDQILFQSRALDFSA